MRDVVDGIFWGFPGIGYVCGGNHYIRTRRYNEGDTEIVSIE